MTFACLATFAACIPAAAGSSPPHYTQHTNVTATVFWIGEPVGNGSTENNAISAWDDLWQAHYGGPDNYRSVRKPPYFPSFRPRENPFYLDLPYNDFDDNGNPRPDRTQIIPWAKNYVGELVRSRNTGKPFSLMKNRWVKLWRSVGGKKYTCYGQIEDSGPYVYDDAAYVFGKHDARPISRLAQNAGMDVSPAIRDCLRFSGLNNDENRVSWQFVDASQVPRGPWRIVVTTRQVYWP
jgi:hypothetical protein